MGFVYFIQASNGLIKIGFTRHHPIKRLSMIAVMSPLPLTLLGVIVADRLFEKWMHRRFAAIRSHGEWFHPGERLLYLIRRWAKEPIRVQNPFRHRMMWPTPRDEHPEFRKEFYAMYNNYNVLPTLNVGDWLNESH